MYRCMDVWMCRWFSLLLLLLFVSLLLLLLVAALGCCQRCSIDSWSLM